MSQLLQLGAFIKGSNTYIKPSQATRKEEYSCPDCNECVRPRSLNGKKYRPHFFHLRKPESENKCNYYSHPSESQIHKDAKMCIQSMLQKGKKC